MAAYRVVFESSCRAGGVAELATLGGITLAVGAYLLLRRASLGGRERFAYGAFVACALVVLGTSIVIRRAEARACPDALSGVAGETVEGVVTGFVPMPKEGHAAERFRVAGREFTFSQFDTRPFFHHAAAFGGPLRDGVQVRVRHTGGNIVRLEVAE